MIAAAGRTLDRALRGVPLPARQLVPLTAACAALYGAAMGMYGGVLGERFLQVLLSAAKVPLLLLVTFALALPSFFVVNSLVGVRDDFGAAVRAIAAGQAVIAGVLASLAPVTLLWYASFPDYNVAVLVNGVPFAAASAAGQVALLRGYRPLIARDPRHRPLLVAWLTMYVFIAIQMAWVLRPFVGDPRLPVQVFRAGAWGNAYVEIGKMIGAVFK